MRQVRRYWLFGWLIHIRVSDDWSGWHVTKSDGEEIGLMIQFGKIKNDSSTAWQLTIFKLCITFGRN